jgi:hypothetical protein
MVFTLTLMGWPAYGEGSDAGSAGKPGASVSEPENRKSEEASLGEIAAKLSNPVSDVWALFTEFDLDFNDGNINSGNARAGGRMIFQPIMPIPIYGRSESEWKLVVRPDIPIIFSQPVSEGSDGFDNQGGLGDIQLPTLVSPPTGKWIFGVGPCWLFPTATDEAFGRQQWGVGPSMSFGYKTKKWLAIIMPQYYFGIGSTGGRSDSMPDASYMNLLYAVVFNLPKAWQIGCNPTITYDYRASAGNHWNVPIGFFVAKTIRIAGVPVKIQLGPEYSVISQDDFGQQCQIRLNVIPVIPTLIKNPIFGG